MNNPNLPEENKPEENRPDANPPDTEEHVPVYTPEYRRGQFYKRVGAGLLSFLKAVCYVLLFYVFQTIVSFLYMAVVESRMMAEAGTFEITDEMYRELIGIITEKSNALLVVADLLLILTLALFFRFRKKQLNEEVCAKSFPTPYIVPIVLCSLGFYVLVNVVISLIPFPSSWVESLGDYNATLEGGSRLMEILAVVVAAPLAEEIIFRGLALNRMRRAMPAWLAVLISALLFGAVHGTPIGFLYASLMGLLMGALMIRFDSLLPSILLHICFNSASFLFGSGISYFALMASILLTPYLLYLIFRKPTGLQ